MIRGPWPSCSVRQGPIASFTIVGVNAIATAGGNTYRANMYNFYVKRIQNGRIVRVAATQETLLQPGDTVEVRERYF